MKRNSKKSSRNDRRFKRFIDGVRHLLTEYASPDDHLRALINDIAGDMTLKYERGQREHGGELWRKECLQNAYQEALDLLTYLKTLKGQMGDAMILASVGMLRGCEACMAIYNMLTCGNIEGEHAVDGRGREEV